MTASPGNAYTNDILGNRTGATPSGGTAGTMTWDCLNRLLTSTQPVPAGGATSTASMSYEYRADGMRVEKILHSGLYSIMTGEIDDQYDRFRYDGQMPMETYIIKADSSTVLMENGLGARGLDYTTVTNSSGTTVVFPIFDAHGNEVASLSRSGSSYSLSNQRSYGAWGEVRQGATTGGPRGRYCASLGHVQDDETGLVYMRARYYEAGSGRFISEDPSANGHNWFIYALNAPTLGADPTGRLTTFQIIGLIAGFAGIWVMIGAAFQMTMAKTPTQIIAAAKQALLAITIMAVAAACGFNDESDAAKGFNVFGVVLAAAKSDPLYKIIARNEALEAANAAVGSKGAAQSDIAALLTYNGILWSIMLATDIE